MIVVSGDTPPLDSVVEVRRVTPRGDRLVDFTDGMALTEFDMDLADIQLLFLIQEDTDTLTDAILFDHAKNAWDMKGFRVTNVGEPIEDNDAVTLAYMQRYVAKYGGSGGGSSGGGDPGGGGDGGGGGSGGTLPPINVNIDEIKKAVLREVLSRINEMKDAIKADVDEAVNRIAEGLERLKNHNVNVLRSAGFVVDEENGTAKFQALEDFKTETGGRFTTVQQTLDAVNASLDLKASRAELEGATTRLSAAEASLDAAKADILLRASKTEVDEISQKLSQAEANIDGMNASISLKAEKAELTGVKDRLTAAELFINANGGNLQGVTIEFQGLRERLEELAQAIATNAETINTSNEIFDGKLALAKTELTSRVETAEGVVASLQNTVASISGEQVATAIQRIETMANDLQAETAARLTLAAKVGENTAAIQTEAIVRAEETGALKAKYGVRVDAGGRVVGWEANNDGKRGDFDVYTDHFRIFSPDADKNAMPFHYDTTSGKLKLNQIEVDGANIKSGSITNAHLSNVQITDSMLQNVTIDGAKIRNTTIDTAQLKPSAVSQMGHYPSSPNVWWYGTGGYQQITAATRNVFLNNGGSISKILFLVGIEVRLSKPVEVGFMLRVEAGGGTYTPIDMTTFMAHFDLAFETTYNTTLSGMLQINSAPTMMRLVPYWIARKPIQVGTPPYTLPDYFSANLSKLDISYLMLRA